MMSLRDARTYLFLGGVLVGLGLVGLAQHYMALETLRNQFRSVASETLAAVREQLRKQEWT
jgi:hypothetical protein